MDMILKKNDLFLFLFFIILIFLGLINILDFLSILLVFLTYISIGLIVEKKSSIHMMFFVGYSTFIFLPALLNWYYLDINFHMFFMSSVVACFFLFLTRETKVRKFEDMGGGVKFFYFVFSLFIILVCLLGVGDFVAYIIAFFIILLSLCFKQNNIKNNSLYFLVFVVTFFVYIYFSWGGFGRTVVFGWLLLALLQFCYSIEFNLNKYFFALLPGLAASLLSSRDILNLQFNGFESSLNDSAYQPYRLSSTFIDNYNKNGFDFLGFFDQILFTLFVYIPRAIWLDKPYGFGFEYTVQHLDQYLVEAGHSIASTLIGDHIYYLGYFGIISSLIVFGVIALLTKLLYRIPGLNGNGVLIFSASMMVLVWGGMTSFSARIALPTIIFLVIYFILRRFLINKTKVRWGL